MLLQISSSPHSKESAQKDLHKMLQRGIAELEGETGGPANDELDREGLSMLKDRLKNAKGIKGIVVK